MLPVSLDCFCFVCLCLVYPMLPVSLDCFCSVCLRLVYSMLPVSLDCFCNIFLFFVLCTLCCQFQRNLAIVFVLFVFKTCVQKQCREIGNSFSRRRHVANFSEKLSLFCLFSSLEVQGKQKCSSFSGIVFVLFVFVLCILCCQFLWNIEFTCLRLVYPPCCQFLWIVFVLFVFVLCTGYVASFSGQTKLFLFCLSGVLCTLCCQFLWITFVLFVFKSCVQGKLCCQSFWHCFCFVSSSCVQTNCQFTGHRVHKTKTGLSCFVYHMLRSFSGVFLFCLSSSCVPYVASFSGLFLFSLTSSCVPHVASFSGLFCALFVFVLCTLCCQFLWIVFVFLVFILCKLCCQFLWIVFVLCLRLVYPYVASFSGWFLFSLSSSVYSMLPVSLDCFCFVCLRQNMLPISQIVFVLFAT